MSTFAQLVAKAGVGMAFGMDISFDKFSTTSYRYGTHEGKLDGTNYYDARITRLGSLSRELGVNGRIAAGGMTLRLANFDGALDWLCNRTTVASQVFQSEWLLRCYVWDPANPTDHAVKTLGHFAVFNPPSRSLAPDSGDMSIDVTLVDRSASDLMDVVATPTLRDIQGDLYTNGILEASTFSNCYQKFLVDIDAPLPLAFHGTELKLIAAYDPHQAPPGHFLVPCNLGFAVACTTDTATSASDSELFELLLEPADGSGGGMYLPQSVTLYNGAVDTLWGVYRSSTVSKGGRNWKVIYIWLDFETVTSEQRLYQAWAGMFPHLAANDFDGILKATKFSVRGFPLSLRTYSAPSTPQRGRCPAPIVAYDLLRYYSGLQNSDVDYASFGVAADALPADAIDLTVTPGQAWKSGQQASLQAGLLRSTLSRLCQNVAMDIFVGWDGLFYALAQSNTFNDQTSTFVALEEERVAQPKDQIPAQGERWAPFTRYYFEGSDSLFHGPREVSNTAIVGRTLVRTWRGEMLVVDPHTSSVRVQLDSVVRPVLTFRYSIEALALLEIGTYFTLSLTRGNQAIAYAGAAWRVEGLTFTPGEAYVEVKAVWMDDLRTLVPFLLDSESYIVRMAGGANITVTDGSSNVTSLSAGSFITSGVTVGDILVLQDSSLAADNFKRFRALRITNVLSATSLQITTTNTDFDAPSGHAMSEWTIVRGFVTYPTVVSDATHYPNGSAMYGKISNTSGVYSDSSAANALLGG